MTRLVDRKQIMQELGVSKHVADVIFRELKGRQVRPPGMRRVLLRRVDVDELLESWTA